MVLNILGIETSCDETAIAVVTDGKRLRSNIIASQVELHSQYGGVVPKSRPASTFGTWCRRWNKP